MGIINVISEDETVIDEYTIFDVLGNKQTPLSKEANTLNISNLAPGTYFLHLTSKGNETVFKIIKTE